MARGKSRSNSVKNIIKQVEIYTNIGIKEVVLTGIHIGQWGKDFDKPQNLLNLLEQLENTEITRYRLGSLNTIEINDKLLDFLSQSKKFCPHFHLSLQSLTDKTLKAMNRKYSAQSCLELMDAIDEKFNFPVIGSDIIVGFPNESDEDFETTVQNANKSKLSNIHVFPYSIRNNTKAANMQNQVLEKIKVERANILKEIAKEKYKKFLIKNINTQHQVIIEKRPDKHTGLLKGVTDNYINILINSNDTNLKNTTQNIVIKSFDKKNDKIIGEIITK